MKNWQKFKAKVEINIKKERADFRLTTEDALRLIEEVEKTIIDKTQEAFKLKKQLEKKENIRVIKTDGGSFKK